MSTAVLSMIKDESADDRSRPQEREVSHHIFL